MSILLFQASQALQLEEPFDGRNFDSALKFVLQRAPSQVDLIEPFIFTLATQIQYPVLSGAVQEISRRFPSLPIATIAAAIDSGLKKAALNFFLATNSVASREGFQVNELNCLKNYNGCKYYFVTFHFPSGPVSLFLNIILILNR